MKILLDHNVPFKLRFHLKRHDVATAFDMGWSILSNGKLLAEAEAKGFDLLITCDQGIPYQQSLSGKNIGVAVLTSNHWHTIKSNADRIMHEIENFYLPGVFMTIELPRVRQS